MHTHDDLPLRIECDSPEQACKLNYVNIVYVLYGVIEEQDLVLRLFKEMNRKK